MELGTQIKKYRQELQISQEELADRVYVSRQTISNWENDKSYPDVHSLMLLSEIFHISLDNLIKGDIEMMKETIQKDDIKKLKHYYFIAGGAMLIACLLVSPLVLWIGQWTFIPVGMLFAVAFCCLAESLNFLFNPETFRISVLFSINISPYVFCLYMGSRKVGFTCQAAADPAVFLPS